MISPYNLTEPKETRINWDCVIVFIRRYGKPKETSYQTYRGKLV